MIKGAFLSGVNTQKAEEYMAHLGIKISTDDNWRKQQTKVRAAIKSTFEERKLENRAVHNAATRDSLDYVGDLVWEKDGKRHSTCRSHTCGDGGGCTRSYNQHHRGRQSGYILNSNITGLPLSFIIYQVSQ